MPAANPRRIARTRRASGSRPRRASTRATRPGLWTRLGLAFAGWREREPETLLFLLVFAAAAVLRFWRPDWYVSSQFHPDERWIFGVVSQLSYPQEPTGLQYGTFPLYLLALIKDGVATIASWFGPFDTNRFVIWGGRMLSAVFDLGTITFTYLFGRELLPEEKGRRLGLLAAAFLAFTVLNVQMAHFFVVDVPLGLTVMATLYFSARLARTGARRDYLWAGVCLGLAMATKTSALPVALSVGAAHVLGLRLADAEDRTRRWGDLALAVGASLITFAVAMPHAFLDWARFWANQNEQRRILVTGEADVPYNRQYLNTLPFLYYGRNLVRHLLGWPLGVLALGAFLTYPLLWAVRGAVLTARRRWTELAEAAEREAPLLVLLTFGVTYALVIGGSFAKFNRYLLPLTPVLCLLAARAVADLRALGGVRVRRLTSVGVALVLAATVLWALAFTSIYTRPHPWIAASRWMLQNIPAAVPGEDGMRLRATTVLNEEWGDDLPVGVEGLASKPYRNNKFPVQEPDTPRKREIILNMLQTNDWIVMADTRAHAVYRRLPDRYPINAAYYDLMFRERLGYTLAREFSNYPALLGREFPDDDADESFTLYDHPHVYLFRREAPSLPAAELAARLDEATAEMQRRGRARVSATLRVRPRTQAAPAEVLPTVINSNIGRSQGRPVFIFGHLNSFTALLAWFLLIEVIGLLAMPLVLTCFPRLPDGGASLAKIAGTLVLTWVVWVLVSLGWVPHLQSVTLAVLLLLGMGAVSWAWRRPVALKAYAARQGRLWWTAEVVFAAAFIGYALTKLYNPDIHNPFGQGYNGGGEPMGMTFLSAVYQSLHFPPYDPWLSGYHINYYYYGHVILGVLAKAIGVPPAWSYSLAISLLFALTVTGVYGLGLGLTGRRRWGLAAAVLAAMFGNLHSFFYLLEPLNRYLQMGDAWSNLGPWLADTWRHAGRFEFIWNPTRLIKGTINEMPWFSFLYGDLHAHIIAIPYSLPVIAWGLNLLKSPPAPKRVFLEAPGTGPADRALGFFLIALALGALSAINTWNFPPYALLVLGVLAFRAVQGRRRPGIPWRELGAAGLGWLRLVAVGLLLMYFFHRYFMPQSTSLAWVNPQVRTRVKEALVFFGLPVFLLFTFWAQLLWPRLTAWARRVLPARRGGPFGAARAWAWVQAFWARSPKTFYTAAAAALAAAGLFFFDQPLLPVLLLLLAAGGGVLFLRLTPELKLATLLAELGLAIVFGCELVHVRDFMGVGGDMSRMNTVFKFYMIVWVLFALAATAALSQLWPRLGTVRRRRADRVPAWRFPAWVAGVLAVWALANYFQVHTEVPWLSWTLVLCLLVLPWAYAAWSDLPWARPAWQAVLAAAVFCAALYPPISLYNRMRLCSEFKHPTLNGAAYLDRMNPQDAKALAWVRKTLTSTDIVLEAPGVQGYNCFDTRVAIFTGLPTLIGWIGQEEQMRYWPELTGSRTEDANRIFGTPDVELARRLMQRYRVTYVYVGANEKKAYPAYGLDKFRTFMDVVYDADGVTIYRVRET